MTFYIYIYFSTFSGQKLYINPLQTQNLMTGVQTTMNPNFKSPNQQTVQV